MFLRCLVGLLVTIGAWANVDDTSTGIDLNRLAHPELKKLRAGTLKTGERVSFEAVSAVGGQFETVLSGRGKSGRLWTVHLCDTCFDEVWRGDLDGNGMPDYAIVGVGGPSGAYGSARTSPGYSLSLLLMDADGMPVPFFTPLYHGDNGEAVKHLVKLDGQVRLLISRYDEIPSDERAAPYCSGHWVTQAYALKSTEVEEVKGVFGGMRFPLIHNWAYTHPECAHNPIGFTARPKLPEVGSIAKGAVTKLLPRDENSLALPVEPVAGCDALFADAILFDTRESREIRFPNFSDAAHYKLADDIRAAGVAVEVRGLHDCTATLLWARWNP